MISMKLLLYLSIGTVAMLMPILIQTKWRGIRLWKSIPFAVCLTVAGTFGTYLWFFIENHRIGGTSFYGAVFVVPIIFVFVARFFKIPYGECLDLCAPAECIMLAVMKVQCILSGCCGGMALCLTSAGKEVVFPSQIMEFANALVLFIVLMLMAYKKLGKGRLYAWYMLIYGVTRFILNSFRADKSEFLLGMPPGHFWSVCSVVIGGIVLVLCAYKGGKKAQNNA